ncbi:pyridoxamine 5'-phosphate oxidase family protein [Microbacterium cremeum]|uniref:pyridoxamine 5'-phosphate oxidase family protein n=1 Tax=Microbacterium cremeum TaxID=2782169 RepID=UPI001886AE48|nr:pyridoxamine 5'-phosphate oxidase family protein [Microbacterium cremeum]
MENSDPVVVLDDEQCWERLREQELGRIVTRVGEVMDIFPVNYVTDGQTLLFRTAQGSKLAELTINSGVLFEADAHTEADAWSVVVHGRAHALDTAAEVQYADGLGLRPWIPTLKYVYVRIVPESVTGRFFERAPEPDRYGIAEY